MQNEYFKIGIEVKYRHANSTTYISGPIYYEHIQDSYVKYMHALLNLDHSEKLPKIMLKTPGEYVQSVKLNDSRVVEWRTPGFSSKRFEMEYRIYRHDLEPARIALGVCTYSSEAKKSRDLVHASPASA